MSVTRTSSQPPGTFAEILVKPLSMTVSDTSDQVNTSKSPMSRVGRLEMQAISKRFTDSRQAALKDIDLVCEPGEFVVVVGPSGCGKTTLLNIAAGMVRHDAGQLLLDGKPVNGPGPDRAMVFQEHGLFPWLTAAENIEFGLKMTGISASERRDRVAAALRMIHLPDSGSKLIHQLSAACGSVLPSPARWC